MAYIVDCDSEAAKEMFAIIKKRIGERGLEAVDHDEWEVHGPHQDMNYQVLVGPIKGSWGPAHSYAVIYPSGVWEIEGSEFWNRPNGHEGTRIRIPKKRR